MRCSDPLSNMPWWLVVIMLVGFVGLLEWCDRQDQKDCIGRGGNVQMDSGSRWHCERSAP